MPDPEPVSAFAQRYQELIRLILESEKGTATRAMYQQQLRELITPTRERER